MWVSRQSGVPRSDADTLLAEGDTTDEDELPEPIVRRKPNQVEVSEKSSSGSETDRPIKFSRGRPRAVRFDLDRSDVKPIAVMHPITRKMIIFTPEKSRDFDLSPENFRGMQFYAPPHMSQSSPILSHSGSLMMSAMLSCNPLADFASSGNIGPAEAFFPSSNPDTPAAEDSDFSSYDGEEDEYEKYLKIEDFLVLDEDSDEGETPIADTPGWESDTNTEYQSTPGRRPSMAVSAASESQGEVHPLLAHFDGNADAVGAFRRNQINQQLINSEKVSAESLAFSSPYSVGTIKGVKNGSLEAVTTPITPMRRQKHGSMSGLDKSPLDAVSQKRKASEVAPEKSHKRHRSISDVKNIALWSA